MTTQGGGRENRQYARRLPPLWWIKRRVRLSRVDEGWHAEYTYGSQSWGVTDATSALAVEGLIDFMRGVKDGSLLREYYRQRAQDSGIA